MTLYSVFRPGPREQRFRVIYEEHAPDVLAYCARRLPADQVDDVAAQVFEIAWRKLHHDIDDPLPWLYAVARREVLAHHRAQHGRRRLVERILSRTPDDAVVVPAPGDGHELTAHLAAALARLTENEREALLLVAWEGLDHRAGGRVVGCTASTFTVRVSRARRKLAAELRNVDAADRSTPTEAVA